MSNLTYIKTRIWNRTHLISALKNLGFHIKEGANLTVSNPYHTREVDFLGIDPNSNNQVGFVVDANGDYSMTSSGFPGISSGALEAEVTRIENKIKRDYARSVIQKKLTEQGFFLVSENENNDSIVIKLSRIV